MPYVLHKPDAIFSLRHTPSWLLLTGSSGMVNGLAFLTCTQYVTHVTGTATRLGLETPHAGVALEYAIVVLSFILGAMMSVLPIQYRILREKRPLWALPLVVVASLLIGIAFAGTAGAFGAFGSPEAVTDPPFVLLSVLAFATGLQNAAVTTSTGLIVRSTHLTGPATDLGVHLGLSCFTKGDERRNSIRGVILRGGKVIAFVTGAGLALPAASTIGYMAYVLPALGVLAAAGLSFMPEWGLGKQQVAEPVKAVEDEGRRSVTASEIIGGVKV